MKKKIENMIADAFVESLKKFDWSTLERGGWARNMHRAPAIELFGMVGCRAVIGGPNDDSDAVGIGCYAVIIPGAGMPPVEYALNGLTVSDPRKGPKQLFNVVADVARRGVFSRVAKDMANSKHLAPVIIAMEEEEILNSIGPATGKPRVQTL